MLVDVKEPIEGMVSLEQFRPVRYAEARSGQYN